MKKRAIILILALICMAPAVSNAQLGNFIRNKASKALNSVAKEKVNAVDSAALKSAKEMEPAPAENQKEATQENQGGMDLSRFLGGKVDLKYNDEYSFTSRLYMVTETYSKKEVMKVDLYMYFSATTPSMAMETKTFTDEEGKSVPVASSMVLDAENKCFILLTDLNGTKMGMISAIADENSAPLQPDGKQVHKIKPTDFKKTGNTKVIAGYTCDEYSFTDPDNKYTGKLWFTKDANLKIDKRGWQKTGMGTYYGYSGFEGGIILGSESYDENGKLAMKSETREISPNYSHSVSLKGVALRQINMNQREHKK